MTARCAAIVVTSLVVCTAVLSAGRPPAHATGATEGVRIEGPERYATAAALFRSSVEGASNGVAVLARGDDVPDALSGAAVSGFDRTGILLTERDRVPQVTLDELARSRAERVTLMGGPEAIGPAVDAELQEAGYEVTRVAGPDRYATAVSASGFVANGQYSSVILASGVSFADALVAGPAVYGGPLPLLLTPPGELHPATREALMWRPYESVLIVGGEHAVSEAVADEVRTICRSTNGGERCPRVERIAGADRTETAAMFASAIASPRTAVSLARGDLFPDALAGAPFMGLDGQSLLLTAGPDDLGAATKAWLEDHAQDVDEVNVFGSDVAVSDRVWAEARDAAQAGGG